MNYSLITPAGVEKLNWFVRNSKTDIGQLNFLKGKLHI